MSRVRRRSRRDIKSEINIVPFLDVLLVLLLIFMATSPIISQSVNVDLPHAKESQTISGTDHPTVILEVSGIGQYSLIIDQKRQEYLSVDEIVQKVTQQLSMDDKSVVLVGGAKNVPYDEIIKALNILKSAGVASVGLMTQPI